MQSNGAGRATRVWVAAVEVSDYERALRFYRDLLGFPVRLDARPRFDWIELGPEEPGTKIGLSLKQDLAADGKAIRVTGIVLDTDDLDTFVDRLMAAGVRFTTEPHRAPWGGQLADFLDPDGNEIQVVFDPDHYRRGS